ncbi:TetR family transcriptional regulator C-terminal domain-containing protein [Variovorax sp. RB2P76]|uniref:TetR family transcriptional regulator C-terminal domain-containing protein n=1 Tax=Variovorax sp. RB2P76 TaxID=3443736 RepID=UPI003F47A5E9
MRDTKTPRSPLPDNPADREIRAANKRKILKAASEVFAAKGFDGARIAEIATVAGLPKANVYYYYATKEELYSATFAPLLEEWDSALQILQADAEPAVALRAYVQAKLKLGRKNPLEARLFANEVVRGGAFLSAADRAHIAKSTAASIEVFEAWMAAKKIRQIDPRHFLFMLWAATQFYADYEPIVNAVLQVKKLTAAHYDQALESIVGTVLGGVLID